MLHTSHARASVAALLVTCSATFAAAQTGEPAPITSNSRELPPATSSHEAPPPAPSPLLNGTNTVIRQAGIGGTTSYARGGVMELGGFFTFAHTDKSTVLAVTPTFGWFVADNVELTALFSTHYSTALKGKDHLQITGLIEPSVHLPIFDHTFVLGGIGAGVAYLDEDKSTGFALAPRLGFNFLIGRSGILTPSATYTWATAKSVRTQEGDTLLAVNSQWGLNIGYSVMW